MAVNKGESDDPAPNYRKFLWKVADLIKDDYEAKDYEDVILPFTLLRRLDCVLGPTRDAVRKAADKYKKAPEHINNRKAPWTMSPMLTLA